MPPAGPPRVLPLDLPAGFDLLAFPEAWPGRYPFLLESVATPDNSATGDFDILFACPGPTLQLDDRFTLRGLPAFQRAGFLASLDAWWAAERLPPPPDTDLPFRGGWFVFLGYELVREIEPLISPPAMPRVPVAFATRIPAAIVRARHSGAAWIIAEYGQDDAARQIADDALTLRAGTPCRLQSGSRPATAPREPPAWEFLAAVARAQELISDGEIFQANLSREWHAELLPGHGATDLYRRLRRANPAPFAGLATLGRCSILSSSPERLVRVRGRTVETRPIAGTRPRIDPHDREEKGRRDLLAHPKERAEHIMLIDLERNDLGRVCEPGTVQVDDFMMVESYQHVHHIVSNIRGTLRQSVSIGELIRAVFPGGTITGCPKVRCMEIIQRLEGRPRGPYTGSMGYLNRDGSCDLNILIRTLVLRDESLCFAAGSGIVADSDPGLELEETRAKAKGMLMALGD
ncbi:MAG: aminodeoxychorismate synthase component I [Gammaproteobacteria bacterium]|nr:aminodeoxychorismate synthase component I [Gammaproteobacteria bacterium]